MCSPNLLQECLELDGVVNFLQAAYVGCPVLNLFPDGRPSVLPPKAPLWARPVQLMCMLVRLR